MKPLTREYTLKRAEISLNYAKEYVRSFWWMLVGVPIFGFACLIFGQDPAFKAIGLICALWPFTIPARAFILTSQASRQMLKPTTLGIEGEALFFTARDGTGMKLDKQDIRSIRLGGNFFVIRTKMLAMALVPKDALLSDEAMSLFEGFASITD